MKQGNTENSETVQKPVKKTGRLKRWLREALFMVVIFTIVSIAVDLWRGQSLPDGAMPDMVVTTIQGENIDVKTLSHEQPVLIYFWATWCSICRVVSPTVNWMNSDYPVFSIALSSGENTRLAGYLKHHGYDFPVVNDNKGSIARQWGVSATPTLIIVKNGKVVSSTTGITTPPGVWLRMLLAG
ncbi:protein disulfide oxidoreductase [Endozoicomonas atrinae]|uniref:protein disulfide oxidoreductase n=1 Tax=Endozoicomonas atrinae TaxID=1333660 RepID=UPI003B0040E5